MGFHNHGYTLNRTHKKHNQQDPLNFKWVRVWFPQLGHALMRRLKKRQDFDRIQPALPLYHQATIGGTIRITNRDSRTSYELVYNPP
jgi:hypothetical protein